MALSKIQAESMNLADTFAFTGTVSGVGGFKKLYTNSTTSTVTSLDIGDTYINTTYDTYYVVGHVRPVNVGVNARLYLKNSSGQITGSVYSMDLNNLHHGEAYDTTTYVRLNYSTLGNGLGYGSSFSFFIEHVNSANYPCAVKTFWRTFHTAGQPEGGYSIGGLIDTQYATIVKGFIIDASDGNGYRAHDITVYGIEK